jgi:hypothetical protein
MIKNMKKNPNIDWSNYNHMTIRCRPHNSVADALSYDGDSAVKISAP